MPANILVMFEDKMSLELNDFGHSSGPQEFPAKWANAWGEDEYGLWMSFMIKDVEQRFRWVSPNTFTMGSPENEQGRHENEFAHEVTLSRGYWMADTTCTQALWQAIMENSYFDSKESNYPVVNVSWNDCQSFIKKINNLIPVINLRLPTEAEWECACRASTKTAFSFGKSITLDQGNFGSSKISNVKALPCNPWGLYAMHGNVWEWCLDWYSEKYDAINAINPVGPNSGTFRVMRGGCWSSSDSIFTRSAARSWHLGESKENNIGFRLVESKETQFKFDNNIIKETLLQNMLAEENIENITVSRLVVFLQSLRASASQTPVNHRNENLLLLEKVAHQAPEEVISLLIAYLSTKGLSSTNKLYNDGTGKFVLTTNNYGRVIAQLLSPSEIPIIKIMDLIVLLAQVCEDGGDNRCNPSALIKECITPLRRDDETLQVAIDTLARWLLEINPQRLELLSLALCELLASSYSYLEFDNERVFSGRRVIENTKDVGALRKKALDIVVRMINFSRLDVNLASVSIAKKIGTSLGERNPKVENPFFDTFVQERKLLIEELAKLISNETHFVLLNSIEELFLYWWAYEISGTENVDVYLRSIHWSRGYKVFKYFVSSKVKHFREIEKLAPMTERASWWNSYVLQMSRSISNKDLQEIAQILDDEYNNSQDIISYFNDLDTLLSFYDGKEIRHMPIITLWVLENANAFVEIRNNSWNDIPQRFKHYIDRGLDLVNPDYIDQMAEDICHNIENTTETDIMNFLFLLEVPRDPEKTYVWLKTLIEKDENTRMLVLRRLFIIYKDNALFALKLCDLYLSYVDVLTLVEANYLSLVVDKKSFDDDDFLANFKTKLFAKLKTVKAIDFSVESLIYFCSDTFDDVIDLIDFRLQNATEFDLQAVPLDGLRDIGQQINNENDYGQLTDGICRWDKEYFYAVRDLMIPVTMLRDPDHDTYLQSIVDKNVREQNVDKIAILLKYLPLTTDNISTFVAGSELLVQHKKLEEVDTVFYEQQSKTWGKARGTISPIILSKQQIFIDIKQQTNLDTLKELLQKQIEHIHDMIDREIDRDNFSIEEMDNFLDELNDKLWIERLRRAVVKFNSGSQFSIRETEAFFSSIARKIESETLLLEYVDLYKKIFAHQMDLFIQPYTNGWHGPQTRRYSRQHKDIGCRCIGDCWLWNLSLIIDNDSIPQNAKSLFPVGEKLDKKWIDDLNQKVSSEIPSSFLSTTDKHLADDSCQHYRRLLNISFDLIPRISLPAEIINLSTVLCPAWVIHAFLKNEKPDIKIYLEKYHSFSSQGGDFWHEAVFHLVEQYARSKLPQILEHILQQMIIIQSEQSYGKSIINLAKKLSENYVSLLSFFLEYQSIKICQNPDLGIPDFRDYENISLMPESWKKWLLDDIVSNENKKKSLIEFIRSDFHDMFEMKADYWFTLFNLKKLDFVDVRKFWQYVPQASFKKAIETLFQGDENAELWFSEANIESVHSLCLEAIKYKEQTNESLPEWFRSWYNRKKNELPSISKLHDSLFNLNSQKQTNSRLLNPSELRKLVDDVCNDLPRAKLEYFIAKANVPPNLYQHLPQGPHDFQRVSIAISLLNERGLLKQWLAELVDERFEFAKAWLSIIRNFE
ncbi:formylglycine-generating enzyme family protein [Candidatus Uabimicrobium sp. HlEnr_7]|uniref:formylglycine-generating enzyme family protein n=1 Tax=Candidatus Uabimicrobium helgolandensis TaxID=3095367 RepID=UPI00355709DA